jgi:hypothetical protein
MIAAGTTLRRCQPAAGISGSVCGRATVTAMQWLDDELLTDGCSVSLALRKRMVVSSWVVALYATLSDLRQVAEQACFAAGW